MPFDTSNVVVERPGPRSGPGASGPRAVTRGESSSPCAVSIDWLSFTFFPPSNHWRDELRHFLRANFGIDGWETGKGFRGYADSARVEGALIAWGGETQRGSVYVDLPGSVCGGCLDWATVVEWLEFWGARLTRVDIAGDDYLAGVSSVDWALAQFKSGAFVSGGNAPKARLVDDLGSGAGRTLYVGRRENGKVLRVYEKGKQLGDLGSPWVRTECEWRGKDRVLPLDMLTRPAHYLAGAYPALGFWASKVAKVRTIKAKAKISYARMCEIARLHAGRAVNAILQVTGGDLGAVVGLLRRSGLPSRLNAPEIAALAAAGSG